MPSLSLRLLAQQALLGLTLVRALAIDPRSPSSPDYTGLTPREFSLADGTVTTVWENLALFVREPQPQPLPPLESQESNNHHKKKKRLQYITYAQPIDGRNDYCGEWNPTPSSPPTGALVSDCRALATAYSRQTSLGEEGALGYWQAVAADFAGAPGGWLTLAAVGTCKFPIRIPFDPLQPVRFGAGDLRFYANSAAGSAPGGAGGRVEAEGGVSCNNGTGGFFVGVGIRVTAA
jgi:hypothetical protein